MNNREINCVIESIAKEEFALAEILFNSAIRPTKDINETLVNVINLEQILVTKLKVALSVYCRNKCISNEYVTVNNDEIKQDLYQRCVDFL